MKKILSVPHLVTPAPSSLNAGLRVINEETIRAESVALADLYRMPYRISFPRDITTPFVFALPHSGRHYPDSLQACTPLTLTELRRSEDAYVDLLFDAARFAAPLIMARFPRAFVDANRSISEIDPNMFEGQLDMQLQNTPHISAGLGVIPKIIREGVNIYRHKLLPLEAYERIERLYHPYHAALSALVIQAHSQHPHVVVVDCHSMPSGPHLADIVIGNRHGQSAPEKLVRLFETSFAAEGFSVSRNQPYAGGYTTALYGQPEEGINAIQIEVNRGLYLIEDQVMPIPEFEKIRTRITRAVQHITRRAIAPLCESIPDKLAAE